MESDLLGLRDKLKNGHLWSEEDIRIIENALEASKLHEQLVERTPNAYARYRIIKEEGKPVDFEVLHVNPALEELIKKSSSELIGNKLREVVPGIEEEWYEACAEVLRTGQSETKQGYAALNHGYIKVSFVAINTREVAVLITDITSIMRMHEALAMGWAKAMEIRDEETNGHSERVVRLTLLLGEKMGLKDSALEYLRWGATIHDIGKIGLRDSLLYKKGRLTRKEKEEMKKHTMYAKRLLSSMPIKEILDIPTYHHEKWDGSGYPEGLKGEEIPLAARIFTVVDVWDALTSKRRYHEAWSCMAALEYIQSKSGKEFDPLVVKEFVALMKTSRWCMGKRKRAVSR